MAQRRPQLGPLFFPLIDWSSEYVPEQFVADAATYLRLRDDHWPRFRLEVSAEGGDALERIAEGKGGVEVHLRTLNECWEESLPAPERDLFHLLGYADLMEAARAGEPVGSELLPRLDLHAARMILQLLRLVRLARASADEPGSAEARERLRRASRALGVGWDGPLHEAELRKENLVQELRELLKRARGAYRSVEARTMSGSAAIAAAREQWEPQIRLVMYRWEAAGGEVDWEEIRDRQWGKILAHEPAPGEPYLRDLARRLLAIPKRI